MQELETQIVEWLSAYGYGAVPFAVLSDPAGIPWAWVFLMLLAGEAGKNIALMLALGFLVLLAFDHAMYWLGALCGSPLLDKIEQKRPAWRVNLEKARDEVRKRGALAIIFGRYLPFIGRWVGFGAGLCRLNYLRFSFFSVVGAALSVLGFGIPAHLLGRKMIDHPLFHEFAFCAFIAGSVIGLFFLLVVALRKKRMDSAPSGT